jgi:type 1 glutamine amidotransferase
MSVRALVLCGDCWHPAETIRRGLSALDNAGFDFEFIEDGAKWSADMMMGFPVVVLAKANMISAADQREWLPPASAAVFQDFLQRGNGLMVVHAGTSRYDKLPAMHTATGGAFLRHPPECDVMMEPQPAHALACGVDAFTVRDEHYFMAFDVPPEEVFLRSRSEHGLQPAGWTRTVGAGRVGVLTPGHNLEVWRHPTFQKLLLNTLRWTAKIGGG